MRSGLSTRTTIPSATSATEQPRLTLRMKLKPKAPTTGYVDGAWGPRSRDLLDHCADGGDAAPNTDSSHGSDAATQRWEIDGGHFYDPVQLRST